ncbi:hypothetical protein AB0B13_18855 [Streptomyces sp. NPDC042898]|uniref:hypothetical protein n=1 Tax=Streptomyces sp. NPDC042898 TaxID=3154334 RepID=UPI0033E365BC
MVTNLLTSFTDWVWIGVGAAVLIAITGVLVVVNQWLTGRSDERRAGVTLTARGTSQIRNSRLEASGTGAVEMTAVENSKIDQSSLKAADTGIRLQAEDGSEISGTEASSHD